MSALNDGGPAFPRKEYVAVQPGMSLRDWFAGQDLVSIAGRPGWFTEDTARKAYATADAMLAARAKEPVA